MVCVADVSRAAVCAAAPSVSGAVTARTSVRVPVPVSLFFGQGVKSLSASVSQVRVRGAGASPLVVNMAKRDEELVEVRKMSDSDINQTVVDLKGELFLLRTKQATRQEFKSSEFRRIRKNIARMLTVRREREIERGIGLRESRKLDREWKRNIVIRPPPSYAASLAEQEKNALGMAVGPALAGSLSIFDFKEPERPTPAPVSRQVSEKNLAGMDDTSRTSTLHQPLLPTLSGSLPSSLVQNLSKNQQSDQLLSDQQSDDEEGEVEDSYLGDDSAVETVSELLKELNMPIKILLWIYFMLKFASELLISESSILTQYYFNWSTSQVSIFLSVLGLTVLPISAVVGNCISNIYEERLVVLWTQITTGVGILAILCYSPFLHYSTYQYVASAIIIFVFTNILEGVNMSLLSKAMSPPLSRGVFYCGLLSTEAGTLARALADGMITFAGKAGIENLVNCTMFPTFFIVVFTAVYTWVGYYSLY